MTATRHWLAWCPDDADYDSARRYMYLSTAGAVAEQHAEYVFTESAGEVGHSFEVAVVEVAEDGTESPQLTFAILVEYDPTFIARERVTL